MTTRTALPKIAPLLFCSGLCALVYQVAWLRELRLVFGASTAASAAVLAIFMGGLGAGGILLGRRADARAQPLMLYADLELLIAVTAVLSPLLVSAARAAYVALGGTVTLGLPAGTAVRIVLAALVLLPPTLLMGGTLPAAAKAAETDDDTGRRGVAVLYGVNTLGAVTGAALSTFVLLEIFGTRLTLWMACLVNALIAVLARGVARSLPSIPPATKRSAATESATTESATTESADTESAPPSSGALVPARFVLAVAAIVGFAFLLMELVWYRMLAPLLGGSSYTFGLILAVALLGVGLGGAAYGAWMRDRPATLRGLALTCALEALCLAVPLALGDRLAVLALFLRPLGSTTFAGLVTGWSVVTAIVVLPAAIVAGAQFPLLIALLGRGGRDVGRHVGLAYAWNTAGAIVGSLAGGFGLLPLLGAPGLWRASIGLLAAVAAIALGMSLRADRRLAGLALPAAIAAIAAALITTQGPTAAWRHSPIGAGRASEVINNATAESMEAWARRRRRAIHWEAEGLESSVALASLNGFAFVVNGKADGHVRIDAGTQVMSGLLGAMLHPKPTRALVVGLGTGSTAGWLGAVPSIERVDVVELEPAILRVARDCGPVNRDVLDNPKVHTFIGDAREVLLTTKSRYDVIFSEPSNPYRAGIASLFTQEFYRSAADRLAEDGIFLQWLQAYEVDARTVRTAYATLASVFPAVETWRTKPGDLILVGSKKPATYDVSALRARLAEEPYRTAAEAVWRVRDVEGVLAHFVARPSLAADIARREGNIVNTDDRNLFEFSIARSVGQTSVFSDFDVMAAAAARKEDRPEVTGGPVDWASVEEQRTAIEVIAGGPPVPPGPRASPEERRRAQAIAAWASGDMPSAARAWRAQPREPATTFELEVLGEALADTGDEAALPLIDALRASQPAEADALLARLRFRQNKPADAAAAAASAFTRYRTDPWPRVDVMTRAMFEVVVELAKDKALGRLMFDLLKEPFAVRMLEDERRRALVKLAGRVDFKGLCVEAMATYEPHVPWTGALLRKRAECYVLTNHPLAEAAALDFGAFAEQQATPFGEGLVEEGGAAPAEKPLGDTGDQRTPIERRAPDQPP